MSHILGMSGSLLQGGARMEIARIDERGDLTDDSTQQHVVKFMQALVEFSARMKRVDSTAP